MSQFSATDYPIAEPLTTNSCEMASAYIKLIFARRGSFHIAGRKRTAFVVGSRCSTIEVSYSKDAGCTEFSLPPWVATAVFDVSGRELSHGVHEVADLPDTPFLSAVKRSDIAALDIAKLAYTNWSVGRGSSDARIAQKVWHALQAEPMRRLDEIAKSIGLSTRRIRAAVKSETGITSAQWRRLIRLERAYHAITNTNDSMATVAFAAGYSDQSHMSRDMAELAGTSPTHLRRAVVTD